MTSEETYNFKVHRNGLIGLVVDDETTVFLATVGIESSAFMRNHLRRLKEGDEVTISVREK